MPFPLSSQHITGPSVDDPLDFETGYLSDENDIDLKKLMWGYKIQRDVARRMRSFRGELAAAHPAFPAGSAAAVLEDVALDGDGNPVTNGQDRIAYTAEDDAALEMWVRRNISTTWHSLGTCKMAPRAAGGVVGPDLAVHGVRGLRIADVSVPPVNVGANTNATALMIGEKAADLFIRELGLARG